MAGRGNTLIIPVETQVRELDPKLLFACVAAEHGFNAVIGSQTAIHLGITSMPRGIYVAKDIRATKIRMLRILKDLGHRIIAWDEEGLVRYPAEQYFKGRVAGGALRRTDMFFAWGADDAALLASHPEQSGLPIHATGNPRIDLLRPEFWPIHEEAAAALRARYGRYVLINSNFGQTNHFVASQAVRALDEPLVEGDFVGTDWTQDLPRYRERLFQAFLAAVPAVARAFEGIAVILRPHPAENHAPWLEAAKGHPNLHVVHEGNVIPWLFGAEVIVHNGCTTAIEALLLERKAITYKPVRSDLFDRHLPDSLSIVALNLGELVAQIGHQLKVTERPVMSEGQRTVLHHHLALETDRLACERIVQILASSSAFSTPLPRPPWRRYAKGWIKARRRQWQKLKSSKVLGSKNNLDYEAHRFPRISIDAVNARIRRFGGLLDRFHHLNATLMAKGIFKINAS